MLAAAVAGVIGFAVYVVASSRTAGVPPTLVETTPSPTVPFGQLAVGRDDTLYFVEGQLGRIDVATKNGTKVSLSSLDGSYAADGSIPDLGAIVVTSDAPWFTANGSLYEANLGDTTCGGSPPRRRGRFSWSCCQTERSITRPTVGTSSERRAA
jgi:hypothetical protein